MIEMLSPERSVPSTIHSFPRSSIDAGEPRQ